jgi:hypothetical protein
MEKSAEHLQKEVHQYLNQQSADLTILRVTLQVLIWNIVRRDPQGLAILSGLKDEVLASLYKTTTPPPGAQAPPDAERLRQISLIRAEKMFQDIEHALRDSKSKTKPPAPGASAAN